MTIVEAIRNKNDIKKIQKELSQNYRDLLLFCFGINSGLRISDILNLNVEDVKGKKYICIKEKKTGKTKQFPINKKIANMVEKYTKNRDLKSPLFLTKYGNRLDRVAAYRIITQACEKVDIKENIGTHSLRKTFGYHYYKKYKDVAMLQRILNHSSPQTTLIYIGITQEEIDKSYINFVL